MIRAELYFHRLTFVEPNRLNWPNDMTFDLQETIVSFRKQYWPSINRSADFTSRPAQVPEFKNFRGTYRMRKIKDSGFSLPSGFFVDRNFLQTLTSFNLMEYIEIPFTYWNRKKLFDDLSYMFFHTHLRQLVNYEYSKFVVYNSLKDTILEPSFQVENWDELMKIKKIKIKVYNSWATLRPTELSFNQQINYDLIISYVFDDEIYVSDRLKELLENLGYDHFQFRKPMFKFFALSKAN